MNKTYSHGNPNQTKYMHISINTNYRLCLDLSNYGHVLRRFMRVRRTMVLGSILTFVESLCSSYFGSL